MDLARLDRAKDAVMHVALAGRIRERYPGFDLRGWITYAVQSEVDSAGSMATLLAEAMN